MTDPTQASCAGSSFEPPDVRGDATEKRRPRRGFGGCEGVEGDVRRGETTRASVVARRHGGSVHARGVGTRHGVRRRASRRARQRTGVRARAEMTGLSSCRRLCRSDAYSIIFPIRSVGSVEFCSDAYETIDATFPFFPFESRRGISLRRALIGSSCSRLRLRLRRKPRWASFTTNRLPHGANTYGTHRIAYHTTIISSLTSAPAGTAPQASSPSAESRQRQQRPHHAPARRDAELSSSPHRLSRRRG